MSKSIKTRSIIITLTGAKTGTYWKVQGLPSTWKQKAGQVKVGLGGDDDGWNMALFRACQAAQGAGLPMSARVSVIADDQDTYCESLGSLLGVM